MLNIFVEGIEESVGAIEISGEGATLTDIRGVREQGRACDRQLTNVASESLRPF